MSAMISVIFIHGNGEIEQKEIGQYQISRKNLKMSIVTIVSRLLKWMVIQHMAIQNSKMFERSIAMGIECHLWGVSLYEITPIMAL